jgi:hypothetical protein
LKSGVATCHKCSDGHGATELAHSPPSTGFSSDQKHRKRDCHAYPEKAGPSNKRSEINASHIDIRPTNRGLTRLDLMLPLPNDGCLAA